MEQLHRVLALSQDERHLAAYDLYQDFLKKYPQFHEDGAAVAAFPVNHSAGGNQNFKKLNFSVGEEGADGGVMGENGLADQEDYEVAFRFLEENRVKFDEVIKRGEIFRFAKENLVVDDDWTFSQTMFGISTVSLLYITKNVLRFWNLI